MDGSGVRSSYSLSVTWLETRSRAVVLIGGGGVGKFACRGHLVMSGGIFGWENVRLASSG